MTVKETLEQAHEIMKSVGRFYLTLDQCLESHGVRCCHKKELALGLDGMNNRQSNYDSFLGEMKFVIPSWFTRWYTIGGNNKLEKGDKWITVTVMLFNNHDLDCLEHPIISSSIWTAKEAMGTKDEGTEWWHSKWLMWNDDSLPTEEEWVDNEVCNKHPNWKGHLFSRCEGRYINLERITEPEDVESWIVEPLMKKLLGD